MHHPGRRRAGRRRGAPESRCRLSFGLVAGAAGQGARYGSGPVRVLHKNAIKNIAAPIGEESPLERDLSAVSPTRDALIRKGLIDAPDHGLLAFSIPGFRQYVVSRSEDA